MELRPPPDQGSGAQPPGNAAADAAGWVGIAAMLLLFGREISGRRTTEADVPEAVDLAVRLHNEVTVVCHSAPTRAL